MGVPTVPLQDVFPLTGRGPPYGRCLCMRIVPYRSFPLLEVGGVPFKELTNIMLSLEGNYKLVYLGLSWCGTHGFLLFAALLGMSRVCPTAARIFLALEMKLEVGGWPAKIYKNILKGALSSIF